MKNENCKMQKSKLSFQPKGEIFLFSSIFNLHFAFHFHGVKVEIRITTDTQLGTFIKRLNRFLALVEVKGKETEVHVPNSGRMEELLVRGNQALLATAQNQQRKTKYTLVMIKLKNMWVSMDSNLPSRLTELYLKKEWFPQFKQYRNFKREAFYKHSRFDFYLNQGKEKGCFLEVKSVTLVKNGIAMFPDAPTQRGRKHLLELMEAVKDGYRGVVLFCVQREDALSFSPNDSTDPAFGQILRSVAQGGVEIYAFNCKVDSAKICYNKWIPVNL